MMTESIVFFLELWNSLALEILLVLTLFGCGFFFWGGALPLPRLLWRADETFQLYINACCYITILLVIVCISSDVLILEMHIDVSGL